MTLSCLALSCRIVSCLMLLCCVVLCCAVLCCVVLCCIVLCCHVLQSSTHFAGVGVGIGWIDREREHRCMHEYVQTGNKKVYVV
jgi:hypothetical protein